MVLLRLRRRGALRASGANFDRRWVLRVGILYAGYEDEYVFWEAIVLVRKASLSAAAVFLAHSGVYVQVVVAVLILYICHALQMTYQPLEHDWHDLMEVRSLMSAVLTLIVCLLATPGGEDKELTSTASVVVSIFVFSVTILFFWSSTRLTLMGVHNSNVRGLVPRFAACCLRRFQFCCCADTSDDDADTHLQLTARGRLGLMGTPQPVDVSQSSIEMANVGDAEWTTRPTERWRAHFSEEHGKEYFVKVGTNETSWDLPEGAELEGLPNSWKRRVSALDGAHFYYHSDSRRSAWTVSDVQAFETSAEGTRSA